MVLPSPFIEPTLRDDLPRYPHLLQLLRVTSVKVIGPLSVVLSSSSGIDSFLYASFVQQLQTDTLLPRDREPCLVDDVNQGGLSPAYYLGRLAGSWTGLPVYEVIGGTPGPPGPSGTGTFSGAYLQNGGQSITNNTLTTITTWAVPPVIGFDTDSYFAAGTPSRLTAPSTGYYQIRARVNWTIPTPAVPVLLMAVALNGTSTYESDYAHAEASTITESNSIDTVIRLTAGDYVEIQVKQTSGVSMSFLTGSGNSPTFQIQRV